MHEYFSMTVDLISVVQRKWVLIELKVVLYLYKFLEWKKDFDIA